MQESYGEGVANHTGPELCGASREAGLEALVGVRAGRVLSPEISQIGVPTQSPCAEGNTPVQRERELDRDPTGSETPRMHGNTSHENREIPGSSEEPLRCRDGGAQREVKRRTPLMHEPGKSDSCVVPRKVSNKVRSLAAEGLEGRRLAKRNSPSSATHRTLGRVIVSLRGGGYGDATANAVRESPFDARQEPGTVVPYAGICGGGGQQWPSLLRSRSEERAEQRLAAGGPQGSPDP
jgi:RNA-directed DNA polymerase